MEITKEYLTTQLTNLTSQKENVTKNVQTELATIASLDGALSAINGLMAYLDIETKGE